MISNVVVLLALLCGPSSAAPINVSVFKNIVFLPNNPLYLLASLSPINSSNTCLCRCYNISVCSTVTYIGANRTCLLYFAQLDQGQPQAVPANMNASVYSFENRAIQKFNRTNETLYPVWNTKAGGNSTVATSAGGVGDYYPSEGPNLLFDGDATTRYTIFGSCNSVGHSSTCGVSTGLYLTLNGGPFTLLGFYIGTETVDPARDPLTFTIEGSNAAGGSLISGSSWTLVYNGSTGIDLDPGRHVYGLLQLLGYTCPPFKSYRFLVTLVRGSPTCASYSELVMLIG